jgi:hypothetical protein
MLAPASTSPPRPSATRAVAGVADDLRLDLLREHGGVPADPG